MLDCWCVVIIFWENRVRALGVSVFACYEALSLIIYGDLELDSMHPFKARHNYIKLDLHTYSLHISFLVFSFLVCSFSSMLSLRWNHPNVGAEIEDSSCEKKLQSSVEWGAYSFNYRSQCSNQFNSFWQRHVHCGWQNGWSTHRHPAIYRKSKDGPAKSPERLCGLKSSAKPEQLPCWWELHCLGWWKTPPRHESQIKKCRVWWSYDSNRVDWCSRLSRIENWRYGLMCLQDVLLHVM